MNRMAFRIIFVGLLLTIPLQSRAQQASKRPTQKTTARAETPVQEITALEHEFAAAVSAKDIDKIMAVYTRGNELFVFDVIPPRQYVGWDAYKKDWEGFLAGFSGPIKFEITDLVVHASGSLGYSHSIQTVSGTGTDGKPMVLVARVSDVYRHAGGKWQVVLEHVSVPVDLTTGKADFLSKP